VYAVKITFTQIDKISIFQNVMPLNFELDSINILTTENQMSVSSHLHLAFPFLVPMTQNFH
jgi:hypothetical protein